MSHFSHLYAIEDRLDHERARVVAARKPSERAWREHNVRMIEREHAGEVAFLARRGIVVPPPAEIDLDLSDDELLAALSA